MKPHERLIKILELITHLQETNMRPRILHGERIGVSAEFRIIGERI